METILVFTLIIILTLTGVNGCNDGDLQLVGGQSENEGRLEFCHDGEWGTVCDDFWSVAETKVACRQLEFPVDIPDAATPSHKCCAYYGTGSEKIFIDDLLCTGDESRLTQCRHNREHNCQPTEAVGIICPERCQEGAVRLSGGLVPHEGRVEICLDSVWRGVCDNQWDHKDAFVTCRKLGFSVTRAVAFGNAYFGELSLLNVTDVGCYGNESSLSECRHTRTDGCAAHHTAGVRCLGEEVPDPPCFEGTIRLANGADEDEGRVEICSNGVWGTICDTDDHWDSNDATVVCRQLGYQNARVFTFGPESSATQFGNGDGPILFSNLECEGTEHSIMECQNQNQIAQLCSHNDDVGVRCGEKEGTNCIDGTIQLVGGDHEAEGRVELCIDGVWGTICDEEWDERDGAVVCQQLGFPAARALVHLSSYFGEGTGPYHLYRVECTGTEDSLLDCYRQNHEIGFHRCRPLQEAGVSCDASVCRDGDSRLLGGHTNYSGIVEVCYEDHWTTVGANDFAEVTCKQIFGEDAEGVTIEFPGKLSGRILSMECNEFNCTYSLVEDTAETVVAAVQCYVSSNCTTGDVRLVNGTKETEGRVEMCKEGVWGVVTDSGWDSYITRLTCQQLGFPSEWAITLTGSYFGRGNAPTLFHNITCSGDEDLLCQCGSINIELSSVMYQDHTVAGVMCLGSLDQPECSGDGDMRLVGGQTEEEGRVEICVDGCWGTVCDKLWGQREAIVACRQAGYASTGAIPLHNAYFGEGSGPSLAYVNCTGSELNLSECGLGSFGGVNCHHGRDSGVRCQGATYYPVTVSTDTPDGVYDIGSTVTFHCAVAPEPPVGVTYEWTSSIPGLSVISEDNQSPIATLIIPESHPFTGSYYCLVYMEGALLGRGSTTISVKGLIQPAEESVIQYTPSETITLRVEVNCPESAVCDHLRALKWYHNGLEIVQDARISLNEDNTTLTITESKDSDKGLYEVMFTGLLTRPYIRNCEVQVFSLLQHYPLFHRADIYLYTDALELEFYTRKVPASQADIRFIDTQDELPFTALEDLVLAVRGEFPNIVYNSVSIMWSFSGGPLPPVSRRAFRSRSLLDYSQTLEFHHPTILESGTYDISLTLNTREYLISYLGCPVEYYETVGNVFGIDSVILDEHSLQLMYYESPSVAFEVDQMAIAEGEIATLTCSATGGYPPVSKVSVKKDRRVLATSEGELLTTSTSRTNAFGKYICVVNNSVVTVQEEVLVKERAYLEIQFNLQGSHDCRMLEQATLPLKHGLTGLIRQQCSCYMNTSHLEIVSTNCSENYFSVRVAVEYANEDGTIAASSVIQTLENWISTTNMPTVVVSGQELMITHICSPLCQNVPLTPSPIPSVSEPETAAIGCNSNSDDMAGLIVAAVLSTATFTAVVVTTAAIIFCVLARRVGCTSTSHCDKKEEVQYSARNKIATSEEAPESKHGTSETASTADNDSNIP